jgi:polyisoprenoid-binding protein YceI
MENAHRMTTTVRSLLRGWTFAALLAFPLLRAGDALLHCDAANSEVEFTLGTTLHTVHGEFRLKDGSVRFDASTGKASGELIVDARSGDSGSGARDHRMHGDVLESDRFPDIVFRPDRMEGTIAEGGPSQVKIHGRFSIHGAEHEITVPAEVSLAGGEYAVAAHFDVPYVKWGMKNPGTFILHVDDMAHITVHTVARSSPPSEE